MIDKLWPTVSGNSAKKWKKYIIILDFFSEFFINKNSIKLVLS